MCDTMSWVKRGGRVRPRGRLAARLTLIGLISVGGMIYIGLRYAGLGPLVGIRPPEVRLELADTGGLTVQNEVTYRGVPIGSIGTIRPTPGGVEASILLDRGGPPVPASANAVVTDRSAIGEVYVDLQPERADGPFLGDGSLIPRERTRLPVTVDTALHALNGIALSVPVPEFRRTLDEAYAAFSHTGPDLARILDASSAFVAEAQRNLPATAALLRDGRTAIGTQAQLGPQWTEFARGMNEFTEGLRRDDPALRRVVTTAPQTAVQTDDLIRETGPDMSRMIANLLTTVRIVEPRLDAVEQFLVTGPWGMAIANTVLPGDGRLHFGIVLNIQDPPSCRKGYLQPQAGWRPATENDIQPMDTSVRCAEAPPVNPRGAQNAPSPRPDRPTLPPAVPPTTVTSFGTLAAQAPGQGPPVIVPGLAG